MSNSDRRYEAALEDFDVAQRVRPSIVKGTGEFQWVQSMLLIGIAHSWTEAFP